MQIFNKLKPTKRKFIPGRSQVSPDRGSSSQLRLRFRKGFDSQPSVITDFDQSRELAGPVNVSRPGNSSIIFRDVNVSEIHCDSTKCVPRMSFLDVGVEGIEVNLDVGFSNSMNQARGVLQCVKKVSLEPVKWLDAERNSELPSPARSNPKPFNRPLPFFFSPSASRHHAQAGVKWTANQPGAEIGRPFHTFRKEIHSARTNCRIAADQIYLTWDHTTHSPL